MAIKYFSRFIGCYGFTVFVYLALNFVYVSAVYASDDIEIDDAWLDSLLTDQTPDGDLDDTGNKYSLDNITGFAELSPRAFLRNRNHFYNDEQLLLAAEVELDATLKPGLTAYIRPRLSFDVLDTNNHPLIIHEAYVTLRRSGFDLRLGQFVENWGIADTFNPVDLFNRRDLSLSLLDTTRLGEAGARGRWLWQGNALIGEPTLAIYVVPWFQQVRFAQPQQRLSLSTAERAFKKNRGLEPEGKETHFYALRYQSTLNTRSFNADLQLLYAQGPSKDPLVVPQVLQSTDMQTADMKTLVPAYYGRRSWGAGLRAVPNANVAGEHWASYTFKLELAYHNAYAFEHQRPVALVDTPEPYLAYVLGFDRDAYNIFKPQDQITLTLEYAGEAAVDAHDRHQSLRPFTNDLITRVHWLAGDFARSSLTLRAIYDFDNAETLAEFSATRALIAVHEDIKLTITALYLDPSNKQQTRFSQIPDNTSVAATLRFDF